MRPAPWSRSPARRLRSSATDSTAELARAREAIVEEEERALAAELDRLDAETSARIAGLAAVDDARVTALADEVLHALLGRGQP